MYEVNETKDKISGGYYIKARKIKNSAIAHAPPHIREIWDYLLREANHSGIKKYGQRLERGQILITYDEILEALHWNIGWRKERYTKHQCEIAMKFLRRGGRKGSMITTMKTTRGLIITILNYNFYQDPKNYESRNECHNESHNESHSPPQTSDTIDKNVKNGKKKETNKSTIVDSSSKPVSSDESLVKNCPHKEIIETYHATLPQLAHIQIWDNTSKKHLKARWRQGKSHQSLDFWQAYFEWVSCSDFLMGKVNNFQADLHWLVNPANFAKVINGRYHNKQNFHDRLKQRGAEWLKKRQQQETNAS